MTEILDKEIRLRLEAETMLQDIESTILLENLLLEAAEGADYPEPEELFPQPQEVELW